MSDSTPKNQSATDTETRAEDPAGHPTEAVPATETRAETTAGPPAREPVLGLSLTQVIGGSAAAATAAALGSRLGLVGTVVGAALISVVTAVAGAVYSRSLQRTREVVARTAERLPTVRIPAQRLGDDAAAPPPRGAGTSSGTTPDVAPARWRRVRWKAVTVTAVVVFLLAGGIVTGIEALTGRSFNGDGRTSVDELIGRDSTPSRTVRTPSDDASPSDRGTTGSDDPGGGGGSGGSGTDEGSGSPATERPTPTPTPTAEPTDGASDGSTTPTPQPSSTSTPSASPGTGTR